MSPDEFKEQTGQSPTIDRSQQPPPPMQAFVREVEASAEFEDELPWSDEEELFIVRPASPKDPEVTVASSKKIWRAAFFLAIVASMTFTVVQKFQTTKGAALP